MDIFMTECTGSGAEKNSTNMQQVPGFTHCVLTEMEN
jgi:hypothetical protein